MVVEVGESSLRQEFWYGEHWIAPEADLADTDLYGADLLLTDLFGANLSGAVLQSARSEERRVGKECRSRWSPYH